MDTIKFSPRLVMSVGRPSCAVVSLSDSVLALGGGDGHAFTNTTEAPSRALEATSFAAGPTILTVRRGVRRVDAAARPLATPRPYHERETNLRPIHDGVLVAAG